MYGIFRIKDDHSVIIDKDALLLAPELSKVSEKELKYIILVYDTFDSPLRKKPMDMRKQMAKRKMWGNISKNVERSPDMVKAIDAYKSLCYDPIRESLDAFRYKVSFINKKIAEPNLNLSDAKEYVKQLEFYESKLFSLEDEVKKEETVAEIKGKKKLSNLEDWQRRQMQYRKNQESLE
jgi:hypothetical protein